MGQYYDILLKREKYEHYDRSVDGNYVMAKLTEHSWWRNETCAAVCRLIYPEPAKVYWIGDYADGADPVNGMTEAETRSVFRKCYGKRALKDRTLSGKNPLYLDKMYLVNYTKAQYIDCSEFYEKSLNKSGWAMHPLPLLTAIGNGLGGGDYRGVNEDLIGMWAGDLIGVSSIAPENFKKNEVYFKEEF